MLHTINHPLVQHKLYLMRDHLTGTKEFRELAYEISSMLGYEAMRKLKTKPTTVQTPLVKASVPALSGRKLALVPILRAGLSMAEAISDLVPVAKIGHIGTYRDPNTYEAVQYFCKLPPDIGQRDVFVLDPMLATGASAIAAINILKKHGAHNITFVCILASPEGVAYLELAHPDVDIYTACVDERLDEDNYIIPGLGDAGDRIFGTM